MTEPQAASGQESSYYVPKASEFDPALLEPLKLPDTEDLTPFLIEYQKLQQALRKSHQSEERFVKKCQDLVRNVISTEEKIGTLERSNAERRELQKELQNEIDTNRAKQQEAQRIIGERKRGIKELRDGEAMLLKRIEDSVDELKQEQLSTVSVLENKLNEQTAQREKERNVLTALRSKNVELHASHLSALEKRARAEAELNETEASIQSLQMDTNAEVRRKDELEKQMRELQKVVNDRANQVTVKKDLLVKADRDLEELGNQILQADRLLHEHNHRFQDVNEEAIQLEEKLIKTRHDNDNHANQNQTTQKELENMGGLTKQAAKDGKKKKKQLEKLNDMVKLMEQEHHRFEDEKQSWQQKLVLNKEQQLIMQQNLKTVAKQMDACVREREVLTQNYQAKVDATKRKEIALRIAKSTLRNIKNEYQSFLSNIRMLSKIIDRLRRERSGHEADLQRRQLQKARAEEEAAERDVRVAGLQAQILEHESRLRQQQNILEAVRGDRNMYSKTLSEQKTEMKEYRRRFGALTNTIQQLKQEITEKDLGFVTEHIYLEHIKADLAVLVQQNESDKQRISELDEVLRNQNEQITKLNVIIADAEEELKNQKKQYGGIVHEQRLLSQQLVQRNEELAALYEKLRLQASVIQTNEQHYNNTAKMLRELEESKQKLLQTLDDIDTDQSAYTELQNRIAATETQLQQEKLKVKALTEELNQSINIHRWRQLQDTDSQTFDMIKQVQNLQKQIISKSAEVEKKDALIQEKEKLYVDLRQILSRQPGSEMAEQLQLYAQTLKDKKGKLSAMKAELEMYQAKVGECKYDLSKLGNDIRLMKLEYFSKKRRELQQSRHTMTTSRTDNSRPQLDMNDETSLVGIGVNLGAVGNDLDDEHSRALKIALDKAAKLSSHSEEDDALLQDTQPRGKEEIRSLTADSDAHESATHKNASRSSVARGEVGVLTHAYEGEVREGKGSQTARSLDNGPLSSRSNASADGNKQNRSRSRLSAKLHIDLNAAKTLESVLPASPPPAVGEKRAVSAASGEELAK